MKKKTNSPKNKNLKYLEKNTKVKKVINNKKESTRIKPIQIKPSSYIYPDKKFEKLLRNYNNFVETNFKNYNYGKEAEEIKEIKKNDIIVDKLKEIKSEIETNILINIKEPNEQFNNFLESINHEYLEEDILLEIPDIPEFYEKNIKLGKNKNNKSDFIRRRLEILKEDVYIDDRDLDIDEPILYNFNENDENPDINIMSDNIRIDEPAIPNFTITDDVLKILEMINAKQTIVDIYRKKMKEKIYIGLVGKNIIRIIGKNLILRDNHRLITNIEFISYSTRFQLTIQKTKSIQELFKVDCMTKEEIIQKVPEIIKEFNIR